MRRLGRRRAAGGMFAKAAAGSCIRETQA